MSAIEASAKLPIELWVTIASHIQDDRDVARFSAVCKVFKAAVDGNRTAHLRRLGIYDYAFGKAKWEKYFGDVGKEPPLPENIVEILDSPCPFWGFEPNFITKALGWLGWITPYRVRDTHTLTLIPSHINGKQLNLSELSKLTKSPQGSANTCSLFLQNFYWAQAHATKSYWVLMTKEMIPGTINHKFYNQKLWLERYPGYAVPRLNEAAISILMEYVRSGTHLYRDRHYTFCLYSYNSRWGSRRSGYPVIIGNFNSRLLDIYSNFPSIAGTGQAGARRFLDEREASL